MFRCQSCKTLSKPGDKQNKLITESRPVSYYQKYRETTEEGNEVIVQGKLLGQGFETVRELNVCINCKGE